MADGKDRDWLGMNAPIERRDMLNGLLVGTGLALAGCAPSGSEGARIAAAEPQNQQGYYPPQRMGMRGNNPGSFENAHALRAGTLKPQHATQTGEDYDLVVAAGGLSGLSAAHFLQTGGPPSSDTA